MNCTPGKGARLEFRVLPDRHQDGCPGAGCTGCEPCPEPHCGTCKRDHADHTCAECLSMVRQTLHEIAVLTTHLGDEAVNGRASIRAELPGGDALVLLAPGNYRVTEHHPEHQRNDPRPVLVVLLYWVNWWRRTQRQGLLPAPSLGAARDYLDDHLHHIAVSTVFPRLARDLSRVLHQLENVLHDGVRPEVSRVPCWECGTRLVKVYGDTEREDHWTCPRCREVYDRGRYDRAKHDHLYSTGADRYVAVSDAVAAIGRPQQTVRTWINRGLVEVKRDPKTGRVWVWWPDVREQHLLAASRSRRAVG